MPLGQDHWQNPAYDYNNTYPHRTRDYESLCAGLDADEDAVDAEDVADGDDVNGGEDEGLVCCGGVPEATYHYAATAANIGNDASDDPVTPTPTHRNNTCDAGIRIRTATPAGPFKGPPRVGTVSYACGSKRSFSKTSPWDNSTNNFAASLPAITQSSRKKMRIDSQLAAACEARRHDISLIMLYYQQQNILLQRQDRREAERIRREEAKK